MASSIASEVIAGRFIQEQPRLRALPEVVFDTSWRVYRRVCKDCTVRFECNSYMVCHKLVGKQVVLRVKGDRLRIFYDNALVVTYTIPEGKGHLVQEWRFYAALKKDHRLNERKYGHGRRIKGRAKQRISPCAPLHDLDVEIRPIRIYDHATGEVRHCPGCGCRVSRRYWKTCWAPRSMTENTR